MADVIAHLTEEEKARFHRINSTDLAIRGICLVLAVILLVRGVGEFFGHNFLQFPVYLLMVPAVLAIVLSTRAVKQFLRSTDYAKSRGIDLRESL